MQEIEPGWEQVLSIWWLLIWRGVLGGFAIGFVIGLILNFGTAFGFGAVLGTTGNLLVGVVLGLIWWPFVIRMALRKKYKKFRIALIAQP